MTDVAVFGATACGVMAAVAARAAGADVVLVEPGRHVGGMVSGGLSWTDVGDTRVLGGLARRFYQAVADHYGTPLWALRGPEPHDAEQLLEGMLDGVDVRLGEREL
ncbi:MAG: FAD-dependent oxidoreductase, partial [Thermoleophilia bacterium]|nr:FAD-dependent oxidoreductase [Thermoleophilia bacterium]